METELNISTAIQAQFAILPKRVQDVFSSAQWEAAAATVAKKYNLSEDQAESLEQETFFAILGMEPLSSYRKNLVEQGEIPHDLALKISSDMDERVFRAIAQDLQETQKIIAEKDALLEAGQEMVAKESVVDHLLPDHTVMEKTGGVHTHTQSTPTNLPGASIVDQKLRGLVRAEREETHIRDDVEKRRKIVYKDADPYREPIE